MKIKITFNSGHEEILEGTDAYKHPEHISIDNIVIPRSWVQSVELLDNTPEVKENPPQGEK